MPKHAVETELGLREQALLYDEYRAIWIKQSGIAGMALGDTKQYGKLYQRRVPYMFIKHKRFTAVATMNSVEIDYVWRYE